MNDSYSDQLVLALRERDVPGQRIGDVVAEVEAYTADSGQDPVAEFGPVEEYSAKIAAQLRPGPAAPRRLSGLLWGYPPAVGSVLLVDGLWGVLKGGAAEITAGEAAFVTLLPAAALLILAAVMQHRWWGWVGAGAIWAVAVVMPWAGDGLVLLRYPAWIGLVCGAALLVGGLSLAIIVNRDRVIDPRTGRDRYPLTLRFALLFGGPLVVPLIILALVALLTD